MNIRLLTPSDAEEYCNLRLEALQQNPESFLMTYNEEFEKGNPIIKYTEELRNKDRVTYGAFKNKKLLGVGTLQLEQPIKIRHKANILAMYVSESGRGLGIGRRLMTDMIQKAKSLRLDQLQLTVITDNERAKHLYSNIGFTVYGIEKKAVKLNERYWDQEHMVLFL